MSESGQKLSVMAVSVVSVVCVVVVTAVVILVSVIIVRKRLDFVNISSLKYLLIHARRS